MPELTHEQLNAGRGALVCMPLLVINLGGEMLYILEQRLRAQNISSEKAMKVLGDVASAMYDETFMKELFVPQPIYTKGPTRHIFDRLAHSSVMRLNKTSMDKVSDMLLFTLQCAKSREEVVVLVLQLFDLMTMGVKYQVLATTHPAEIIDVTINHMQSVKEIVNKPAVSKFIDSAAALVDKTYSELPTGELYRMKHTLTGFFQDKRIKVSLFLQDGLQNHDGTFYLGPAREGPVVYHGTPPGKVFYYNSKGALEHTENVPQVATPKARPPVAAGSASGRRQANPHLGMNLYSKGKEHRMKTNRRLRMGPNHSSSVNGNFAGDEGEAREDTTAAVQTESKPAQEESAEQKETEETKRKGDVQAGLNLLASLIGTASEGKESGEPFSMDLFGSGSFSLGYAPENRTDEAAPTEDDGSQGTLVINVDADEDQTRKQLASQLRLDDWDTDTKEQGNDSKIDDDDDLLDLMDQAGS